MTDGNVFEMTYTVSQIIEAKGGPAAVAAKVGRKPGAVRAWKHRGIFPRSAWPEITAAYPDLTVTELKALEARPQ